MMNSSEGTILKIEGMTCGHCKMKAEKALNSVPGVERAEVNLEKKQAVVSGSADRVQLVKAVEEAGYSVVD